LYYPDPIDSSATSSAAQTRRSLLYADLRYEQEQQPGSKNPFDRTQVIRREITANVLKALELDCERRIRLVDRYASAFLRAELYYLAGLVRPPPDSKPPASEQTIPGFRPPESVNKKDHENSHR
jgi:hypothetical protein